MAKVRKNIKSTKKSYDSPFKNYWTRTNYIILGIGIVLLIIGYFLMAQDPWNNPLSLSISPIILLIAYLVVFPLSIFYRKSSRQSAKHE